ncbi:MAG: O-antigen ligase family protein [Minwuia sp.]|nr:O-antigen ligase family protein [Minwuia sp.]
MTRTLALLGIGLIAFLLPWIAFFSDRSLAWLAGGAAILGLPWLIAHGRTALRDLPGATWLGLAGLVGITALGLLSPMWADAEHAPRMQVLAWRSALALVTGIPLLLVALRLPGARQIIVRALIAGIAIGVAIALFDLLSDHLALRIRTVFAKNLPTPDGVLAAAWLTTPDVFMSRFNDFWVIMTSSVALVIACARPGWLFVLALLAMLTMSFFTISETSQLIGVIGILVFVFCRVLGQTGVIVMALVTTGVLVATPVLFPAINNLLLASIDGSSLLEYKLLERFEIWAAIAETALDRPLLGYGLEYERLKAVYTGPGTYYQLDHLWHPHSLFVQLWQDIGLAGVVAACAMLIAIHLAALSLTRAGAAAVAALTAMAVGAFGAAHSIWLGWWICLFIILTILAIAGTRDADREQTQ